MMRKVAPWLLGCGSLAAAVTAMNGSANAEEKKHVAPALEAIVAAENEPAEK
jgi:hypothetical protein